MQPILEVSAGFTSVAALVLAITVLFQLRSARSLRKLACTDPFTGLANRREFTRALAGEIARTSRTGRPFTVVLVDLDRLKLINDRCGHRAGDRAIMRVANALRVACRATDTAGRIGGDEFAVILPETDELHAAHFLERVRTLAASHRRGGVVTVSGGVAQHPEDGHTSESLLEVADKKLYAEKQRQSRMTPPSVPRLTPGAQRQFV